MRVWRIATDTPTYTVDDLRGLGAGGLPLNRYLLSVEIPEVIWRRRQHPTLQTAPVGWDALPTGKVSLDYGDAWLTALASALLVVPAIVVPDQARTVVAIYKLKFLRQMTINRKSHLLWDLADIAGLRALPP
jgi:hypothetical protein